MHLSYLISFSLLYSTSTLALAIQARQNSPTVGAPVTALPAISCFSKDDTCASNTGGKDCDDAINENCNQAALKYPGSQDQLSDIIQTTVRSCALSFTRGSLPFVGDQPYNTTPGANLTAITYAACTNEFQAILNSCNTPKHIGGMYLLLLLS